MIDISIIYVNYFTEDYLLGSIRSLVRVKTPLNYEIIIVNNGGGLDKIRFEFPAVRVVDSESNVGFGVANNIGVKYSRGQYLFLCNPDTLFIHDNLSVLYEHMILHNQENGIGVIGCRIFDNDGNENFSSNYFLSISKDLSYLIERFSRKIKGNMDRLNFDGLDDVGVDAVIGCNMFMRRDVFLDIGGFDSDYFMYFEDLDLSYRLYLAGYQSRVLRNARFIHFEGGAYDSNLISYKAYTHYVESLLIYLRKNMNTKFIRIISNVYFRLIILLNILFNGLSVKRLFRFSFKEKLLLIRNICTP